MCSPNLRSVSLSLSHSNCRSCQCKPIEDGGLRLVSAFLILLAHERSSNVIFLVLLAQKNLVTIFFSKIFCSSCAGEFSRHFVCGKSLHGTVFFFSRKTILNEKNFFWGFFSWSWKTKYRNFQGEQKLRISAKMRKIGSTDNIDVESTLWRRPLHCKPNEMVTNLNLLLDWLKRLCVNKPYNGLEIKLLILLINRSFPILISFLIHLLMLHIYAHFVPYLLYQSMISAEMYVI